MVNQAAIEKDFEGVPPYTAEQLRNAPPPTSIPTMESVVAAIARYHAKPGNEVGGNLHIVLDDLNLDDDSVRFCLKQARDKGDTDGVALAELLLTIDEDFRELAVDAYWNRVEL